MKIFITGTYRSGTTLVAQILNNHPLVEIAYDSTNFMRFGWQKYGQNKISITQAYKLGEDFNKRLIQRFGKGIKLTQYKKLIKNLSDINYAEIYNIILTLYTSKKIWGEKTTLEWRAIPILLNMFDDMHIIHVIRDPRAVLVSWKNMTKAPGLDYLDCVNNTYDSMSRAIIYQQKYKNKKRYFLLKFENLLKAPSKTTRKLCKFLNIKYTDYLLNFSKTKGRTNKQWEPNSSFNDMAKNKISTKPINRWKKIIQSHELFLCELVNGKLMKHFKYDLSKKQWDLQTFYKAIQCLHESPLTYNGILKIIYSQEGVERFPLNPFNPKTWDKNPN